MIRYALGFSVLSAAFVACGGEVSLGSLGDQLTDDGGASSSSSSSGSSSPDTNTLGCSGDDSCNGKADGTYCSALAASAAYTCANGQIVGTLACAEPTGSCIADANCGATIVDGTLGCNAGGAQPAPDSCDGKAAGFYCSQILVGVAFSCVDPDDGGVRNGPALYCGASGETCVGGAGQPATVTDGSLACAPTTCPTETSDSCSGKADGTYCSVTDESSAYTCHDQTLGAAIFCSSAGTKCTKSSDCTAHLDADVLDCE